MLEKITFSASLKSPLLKKIAFNICLMNVQLLQKLILRTLYVYSISVSRP